MSLVLPASVQCAYNFINPLNSTWDAENPKFYFFISSYLKFLLLKITIEETF